MALSPSSHGSPSAEWLSSRIIDQTNDAVIFCDRHGLIRLWNAGATRIFRYSAEEAIGAGLDLIIPVHLRERHWKGYHSVMRSGVTRYGADVLSVPAMRRDGERISIEFTVTLVRDGDQLLGAAAVIRDVTARWERERALRGELARLKALATADRSGDDNGPEE